ncbi:helix-turn-helix domain-containing protein [Occallatibacter riparius]|uniref:helix-turn-helix domain-containing protein n=1 Tax=Occallatibacter riparius TaxID=1002689 RepID=UPI0036F26021
MCRDRHIPGVINASISSNLVHSVPSSISHTIRTTATDSEAAVAQPCFRSPLHFSTIRQTLICPVCQLSQFERGTGKCRRCHSSLGLSYFEILFPTSPGALNAQSMIAIGLEVGSLIRNLRFRRGITQETLASLTGIHRTYLSRVERGQVMPSLLNLLRIMGALGVDKILLRARIPSS